MVTLDELLRIPLTIVIESREQRDGWVRVATIAELPELSVVGEDMDELVRRTERERFILLAEAVVDRGWLPNGIPLKDVNIRAALAQADLFEFLPYLESDALALPVDLVRRIRKRIGTATK